jgi:hypothetical protein
MIIFRCENWPAILLAAGFALLWHAALVWFLRRGVIALGSGPKHMEGYFVIERATHPRLFLVAWATMASLGGYVVLKIWHFFQQTCQF